MRCYASIFSTKISASALKLSCLRGRRRRCLKFDVEWNFCYNKKLEIIKNVYFSIKLMALVSFACNKLSIVLLAISCFLNITDVEISDLSRFKSWIPYAITALFQLHPTIQTWHWLAATSALIVNINAPQTPKSEATALG